ncbi:SH3 domain-containing protein [Microcoleus sp. D2_18a_D3]|uniref:SH3 domain-containing protein n=1 Tax=Microcoleus sp. D2_18a_D3 TaxID=3055330 RepID=UPI002FD4D599
MQEQRIWQKYTTLTSSIFLTATVLVVPSFAADTNQTQIQGEYLLAQALENCRPVIATNGLNVRRQPRANSEAVGIIDSARNVTIQNLGENGWVPITGPIQGYVYGGFLGACEAATASPPTNCRQVAAARGINVHQAPSTDGESVGVVANGRRVTIESLGTDGWVPITVPVRGYVQTENRAYCS